MKHIGAHVSAAGGIENTPKRAADIGCNSIQLFSGSPRVWKKPDLAKHDVSKLFSEMEKYNVLSVFTHAIYLVNLASDKPELIEKSLTTLKYDMAFDALVKGSGVIVHLGSHQGRGWENDRDQVAAHIKDIINSSPKEATFLIENSAGQKGKLCSDLNEIRWLLDEINSPQLGWCFDTCHGFTAGYELNGLVIDVISDLDLWSTLKCIHVNDSRDEFDSGRDRHANLGEGNIPEEDLKYFLNHERVKPIPLLLEVPGAEKKGPDAKNVKILKDILS